MAHGSYGHGSRYSSLELLLAIGIFRVLVLLMRLACFLPSYRGWRRRDGGRQTNG